MITGKTIEQRFATGIHTGIEILPFIVATVKFEDIIRDSEGKCSLRDPKIVNIRHGATTMTTKEKIVLKLGAIADQEPILEQILDILETRTLAKRETTPNGRIIRTREDLMKMDCCHYPQEDDL